MAITSPEFVGACQDFHIFCIDHIKKAQPRSVLRDELHYELKRAQRIVKSFTPNGNPFFEDEKNEALVSLKKRYAEALDAIADIIEIRSLKRNLSAQKYVDKTLETILNMPFVAASNAARDVDFNDLNDVRRYRSRAEDIIWSVIESAMKLAVRLLYHPGLIDDDDISIVRGKLHKSAEFHIKRTKAPSLCPERNDLGELVKPTCDVCGQEEAWETLDDFRVGPKCLHEFKQIAFVRATDEDHDTGIPPRRMEVLRGDIRTIHDKNQLAVLGNFLELILLQPNNLDYDYVRDLRLLVNEINRKVQD